MYFLLLMSFHIFYGIEKLQHHWQFREPLLTLKESVFIKLSISLHENYMLESLMSECFFSAYSDQISKPFIIGNSPLS